MAERFDFDITPKAYQALVESNDIRPTGPNGTGPLPNGYTIQVPDPNPTNIIKRHRHKLIEIGDETSGTWTFNQQTGGLVDISAPGPTLFRWRIFDTWGADRVIFAEAEFNVTGTNTLEWWFPGVSTATVKGTDNLDELPRFFHAFDVHWQGVDGRLHDLTIAQGRGAARGGHAQLS